MFKPSPTEYAPYFENYIKLVDDLPLAENLELSFEESFQFFFKIPKYKWDYAYEDGKWTIKEILVHIIDTEWVFAYRALRFSRRDKASLPGFDQDLFVTNADYSNVSPNKLLEEWSNLRKATKLLFSGFSSAQLELTGVADKKPMSVRAAGFILIGHPIHHQNIIDERYL